MELTSSELYQIAGEALVLWMRGAPQREVQLAPDSWLAMSGEPLADLNLALVDQGPRAEERLRAFHQALHERGLPALYLLTEAVADQLAPTAQALGLHHAGKTPLMVCNATDIRSGPSQYTIQRVENTAELEQVCQVLASAFSLPLESLRRVHGEPILAAPGLTLYLAYAAAPGCEQPASAAVSTVATVQSGPVIGVWAMGTAAGYQRQGAGCALLTHVMADHHERGAQCFYLLATQAGKRLYDHIGYRTVAELDTWVRGHSTQVSGY